MIYIKALHSKKTHQLTVETRKKQGTEKKIKTDQRYCSQAST